MQTQISLSTQIKRLGLAAAIAAFAYQPAIQANMQSSRQTFDLPSPTTPMLDTFAFAAPNTSTQNTSTQNTSTQNASANALKATPNAATKQLAQAAPFVSAAHATAGSAQIVEENGQRYLEFDAAFRSDSGPDLFVLLHREAVPESYSPEDYVNLGRLQALEGTQRYAIPAGIDISQLQSAVIWCQDFNVTFGYAVL